MTSSGSSAARISEVPCAVVLPDNLTTMAIANTCRCAVLAFLAGASDWGKRDLAEWLHVRYRALTSHAANQGIVTTPDQESGTFSRRPRIADTAKVTDVVHAAKEDLLATLLGLALESDERFARHAITAGHVVRTRDRAGRGGWAPVDAPGMRFTDRLLSLLAVDYWMRPADYMALLSVCGACGAVAFDAQARVRGECLAHARLRPSVKLAIVR
jgi:hypothetical protein